MNGRVRLLIVLGLLLTGCSGYERHLVRWSKRPLKPSSRRYTSTLQLRYLGVGGWHIKWGNDELLTAPFFSNPSLARVLLRPLRSRPELIEQFLGDVSQARAILVGHAHYDHLLDVPTIAARHARRATIYGSPTTRYILAGARLAERTVALEGDDVARADRPGRWIGVKGTRIRFMAIRSEHAPHKMGIKLFRGSYSSPLKTLPRLGKGWVEGQTLAYLIDLLGPDDEPTFRLLYHDACAGPPLGMPPPAVLKERAVDMVILCVPGYDEVEGYPDGVVGPLQPRFAVLGHWEDFFRPLTEPLVPVPGTSVDDFVEKLRPALPRKAKIRIPRPGVRMRFR